MRASVWLAAVCVVVSCAVVGCGGGRSARASRPVVLVAGGPAIRCEVPHAMATDQLEDAARLAQSHDPAAVPAFVHACDAGNPCACTEAGEAFVDAELTERDVTRGLALLDRGCSGGDVWGCWAEASAVWRYDPARVDHAAELLENACEDENMRACGELGRFRISGLGGGVAPSDAIPLYEIACQGGESYSCYLLGQAFVFGVGTHRDPERARELLTWACDEAEIAPACTAWARTLAADDPARSDYLTRGCEGGDVFACDDLDRTAATRTGSADATLRADPASARELTADHEIAVEAGIGGSIDLATLGLRPSCIGFVGDAADAVVDVPAGLESIAIRAHADADTVLAVRDPSGHWTCADDAPAGAYQATITVDAPAAGTWAIWGGALRPPGSTGEIAGSIEVRAP